MHTPTLARIWQALRAAPSLCALCQRWPAQRLCPDCLQRFAAPRPRCRTCAALLPAGASPSTPCGQCLCEGTPLHACHAAVSYAYPWAEVIAQFKFHGDASWAAPLAALLRRSPWVEQALATAHTVLPIPLGRERLRLRGFNQSLLLARALAAPKVQAHVLLRLKDSPAQSTLPRAQRWRNLQHAFVVEPLHEAGLRGQNVLLVDDVMTTGATLHSAATVLRQAGAARVQALVLARTLAHGTD